MLTHSPFKSVVGAFLQWLGVVLGFVVCLVLTDLLLPFPKSFMEAAPASGFLSPLIAFLFNGAVNALILVWAARRSSARGWALWAELLVLSFGAQVFLTQIETAYFISSFPLLAGNFEVYRLVLRGLVTSALLTLFVTGLTGGFSKAPRPRASFAVTARDVVRQGAWLSAVYIVLYVLFGYFVAWQSQTLRLFYGGPAQLNSFFAQWGSTLMGRPEIFVFQYFRGELWILCLLPVLMTFNGKRAELVVLAALALGLLPTAQLAFANPLMPATISAYHFVEVSLSTGIFGALCAWFIPRATAAANERLEAAGVRARIPA